MLLQHIILWNSSGVFGRMLAQFHRGNLLLFQYQCYAGTKFVMDELYGLLAAFLA